MLPATYDTAVPVELTAIQAALGIKPLIANLIDIIGDSRALDNGVSVAYPSSIGFSASNFLNWANALSDQRARVGTNFGFSGRRTDEYFGDRLDAMLASPAKIALIGYPIVNNLTPNNNGGGSTFPYTHRNGASVALADVGRVGFEDVRDAALKLVAVGKTVIVTCEPGATNVGAPGVQQIHDFNARLKTWAASTPGVFCWSANPVLWSPTGSATQIVMRAGMLVSGDPTHYGILGGYTAGKELAKIIRTILPASDLGICSINDNYGQNPRQLIRNALFNTLTGGTRTTVTGTGNIPSGWTLIGSVATTVVNVTSAPNAQGFGNDITLAITASADDTLKFISSAPSAADWALTDVFEHEFEADVAAGAVGAALYSSLVINTNLGTSNWWTQYAGVDPVGSQPVEAHSVKLKSQRATPLAGSVTKGYLSPEIYVRLKAGASITVTIRRVSCLKIT